MIGRGCFNNFIGSAGGTQSHSGTATYTSRSEKSTVDTSKSSMKRPSCRRESASADEEEDDDGKRRKKNGDKRTGPDSEKYFACPFHKFNPLKYCCNSVDGFKFRSCAGPGFPSIARLKWVHCAEHLIPSGEAN